MYPRALGVVQLRGEIDPPLYGFIVEEMCFYYGVTSWRQIAFSCHGDVLISRMVMTMRVYMYTETLKLYIYYYKHLAESIKTKKIIN